MSNSPVAAPETEPMMLIRVPVSAWETLSETLQMDSKSHALDSALREKISGALEKVDVLTGAHAIDFGSSENAFSDALQNLCREGYRAMINGADNVALVEVRETTGFTNELVVKPEKGKKYTILLDEIGLVRV